MIWLGCFEKLLDVIRWLSRLVFKIMLGNGNELLVGVVNVLIIITFVTTGGDCDSLGPALRPPLVTSGAPLCTLVSCFGCRSGLPSRYSTQKQH
jgi:hypothetical protein